MNMRAIAFLIALPAMLALPATLAGAADDEPGAPAVNVEQNAAKSKSATEATQPAEPSIQAPAVTGSTAKTVAGAPALPPNKPDIPEKDKQKGVAAKYLFAGKKLPSIGHAMAIGYYPRGCLQGGVELPISGPTWQVMRLSRNRNWGHPDLIKFLERFAPAATKATGRHGILVGDLAQPRGGPLPFGHASHQIGLDVDIWFMPMPDHTLSKEERENISASNLVAADGMNVNPKFWSTADAAFIRTAAEQPGVERVLVNAAIKKRLCDMQGASHPGWMSKVRPWYGHADHIHVRLKCPADSPNCRAQAPVPAGAGCETKDFAYWFKPGVLHPRPSPTPAKPAKALSMADLPPACKTVLDAPAKKTSLAGDQH
jgi:penicillin-insensitive murein endopeptidase